MCGFQSQGSMFSLEEADELDASTASYSTGNILEHFPYLRHDGFKQMQGKQSGPNTHNGGNVLLEPTENKVSNNGHHTHLQNFAQNPIIPGKEEKPVASTFSNIEAVPEDKNDYVETEVVNTSNSVAVGETAANGFMHKRSQVSFFLKGKLGHDMDAVIKSVRQILIEPVDVEERFYEDFVYNYYPKKIKEEPADQEVTAVSTSGLSCVEDLQNQLVVSRHSLPTSANQNRVVSTSFSVKGITAQCTNTLTRSVTSSVTNLVKSESNEKKSVRYTEPSIAEIRAGLFGSSGPVQNIPGLNSSLQRNEKDTGEEDYSITETNSDREEHLSENENDGSEVNESSLNENWYNSAISNFSTDRIKAEEIPELTPSAKKGGRSDPENPFALTSPSFNDSTAKALMTTTQTPTATIVMISIMSIGSRAKLIPKIVNSKAAEGGLISILNPVEPSGNKSTQVNNGDQISTERTSIMSRLRRDKSNSGETNEASSTNIDRLDVNIKIDDTQYVGHGENKRWLCKICPKSYTTKHNLVAHILDHSDIKPHLCLLCEKYFKQLSHLNTHMLTHDNVKPYVCTQCGKGFTQISHLKRHETVHMGSKPYRCDICNRGFAYPSELRLHKEKHVSGKEKCTDCDKEFESWSALHEHMVSNSHCNELQCEHCDRIFRFPSQLRDHMLSHAGSRPFICKVCGMDFMKEHHLKSHMFTHTGLRPYSCPECGRAFNQKANMQRHMLIHNAERAYKCDVCSKTFTQPQTLKAHMVVHSETKPYKCNICGKQFGRQHNLQGHMHIHSDTKPYSCSICQASFTLKGNLNRHKKFKHGLDESTEVMEENAVNFLSTLSDRTHEHYINEQSDIELDQDSRDSFSSPDSRSSRKGRKSVPRKRVSRHLNRDNDGDNSNDADPEQMITYSDEERENERTRELASEPAGSGNAGSRRKRKRGVVYRVDHEDRDIDSNDESDGKEEANGTSLEDQNAKPADVIGNAPSETRSVRKRKKKDYGDDFTETGYDLETAPRSQKKKSSKLETIIADNFNA